MILADSSVWIDHLRRADARFSQLLSHGQVMTHAFIIGELAMGSLAKRRTFLQLLDGLPKVLPGSDDDVLGFVERHALHGQGIGYVDAHLLVAAKLNAVSLVTRDKRLCVVAEKLGLISAMP